MTETLVDVATDTVSEVVPSLDDFANDPGGAWPNGWYRATVIQGYASTKGKQFVTGNVVSQRGDSFNARICLKLVGPKGERIIQENINYRTSDFSADRLAFIKQAREENKGVRGRWADTDAQRTSLALGTIGEVEKAFGVTIRTLDGVLTPATLNGKSVDVRLSTDDKGFNVPTGYTKAGEKVKS